MTLKGDSAERVEGADAYRQEGQLVTFYRTRPDRQVIDCWSVPVASYRTSEILKIRRVPERLADRLPLDRLARSA